MSQGELVEMEKIVPFGVWGWGEGVLLLGGPEVVVSPLFSSFLSFFFF